jgi:hypothetical protein
MLADRVGQLLGALGLGDVTGMVIDAGDEAVPDILVDALLARFERGADIRAIGVGRLAVPGDAINAQPFGQQPVGLEMEQGRQQHAAGEIPGAAEQYQNGPLVGFRCLVHCFLH